MKRISLDELRHLPVGSIITRESDVGSYNLGELFIWHNCFEDHGIDPDWDGKPILLFGYAAVFQQRQDIGLKDATVPQRFYYSDDSEQATGDEHYYLLEPEDLYALKRFADRALQVYGNTQQPLECK